MFDDASVGLTAEPFVAGMTEMIDQAIGEYVSKKFAILFSDQPDDIAWEFNLEWQKSENGGNWYYCPQLGMSGWLCPALYHYFDTAPPIIYVLFGYNIHSSLSESDMEVSHGTVTD